MIFIRRPRRVLALAAALALGTAGAAWAQSYFNNQTTTTVQGTVAVSSVAGTVAIGGTVAVSGTVPVTLSGAPAVSGTVTAAQPTASPTDCSTTLTTIGTAYQVIPTATTRQALTIQNLGTGNMGLSLTSTTPVIGAAGTFTLAAGATYTAPAGITQSTAIWAVGSVASQVLTCTRFN